MDDTLEILMEQIEERRKQLIEGLGDGGPKDYAEYRYIVGMVRGLLTAQDFILTRAKTLEEYDE